LLQGLVSFIQPGLGKQSICEKKLGCIRNANIALYYKFSNDARNSHSQVVLTASILCQRPSILA
jgi:hypothetical protein